jgi:3-hydroxyisobutyrate dehydrogenase
MTMMSSARPEGLPRADAVLDAMAGKVYRLGDRAGAGSKVKIINKLLAGVHIAAAAEAMALALREGVAPALYEVIARQQQLDVREPHGPRAGRRLHAVVGGRHLRQGPGLVLDTARASKFPLPLASTAHQMFMQASTPASRRKTTAR